MAVLDLEDYTYPVSIIAYNITSLPIDIVAQTIGNISVNIAASAITLNVAIQSSAVTLNVNIQSQTVDINIKTSGGANIVIDKLTQAAYTERRSTLSNDPATLNWESQIGSNRRGKFFPRGARGFISTIDIQCLNIGAVDGTITVYISPQPGIGYIASATINVPAGAPAAWRGATFNCMWNYDSLFIFWVCSIVDIYFSYDYTAPIDGWISSDGGVSWSSSTAKYGARAVMIGETVGDIPVSGTINTIEIPSISSGADSGAVALTNANTWYEIFSLIGAGDVTHIWLLSNDDDTKYRFTVDGGTPLDKIFGTWIMPSSLALYLVVGTFYDGFCVPVRTDEGETTLLVTVPFKFKKSFKVEALNVSAGKSVWAGCHYRLIK